MIRTFKLQNANGQTYDLTPAENFNTGVFLDPAGLGVTYNNNLYQIGNRFAVINRKRLAKNISGKLLFPMPESYKNYEKFARFIDKVPLKLLYNPTSEETNEYEFEVEIKELTKTEIEEGGLLCNLNFNALTLPRKVIFIESEKDETFKNTLQVPYELNALEVNKGENFIDNNGKKWMADFVDFNKGVLVKRCKKHSLSGVHSINLNSNNFISAFFTLGTNILISNVSKVSVWGTLDKTHESTWYHSKSSCGILLNKNRLSTPDLKGVKKWCSDNNAYLLGVDLIGENITIKHDVKNDVINDAYYREYKLTNDKYFKKGDVITCRYTINIQTNSELQPTGSLGASLTGDYYQTDLVSIAIDNSTGRSNVELRVTLNRDVKDIFFRPLRYSGRTNATFDVDDVILTVNDATEIKLSNSELEAYKKLLTYEPTTYLKIDQLANMIVEYTDINGKSKKVTGTDFKLEDTKNGNFDNIRIYGRSWQNGEPTIDSPKEIHSIDNPIVYSSNTPIGTDVKKNYNYKYNYQYSDGATNTITLDVDVSEPSPVELIIRGYTENPKWKHYVNGELVATGQINATILDGNSLVVSSELPKMQILQKDNLGNVVNDLYQNSVWDTERFLFLRRGKNVITVSDESSSILNISLKGFLEYATI